MTNHEQEPRPQDKEILSKATEGIDFSPLDAGASSQYLQIPGDEIIDADKRHPLKGNLSRIANLNARLARSQAENGANRERKSHNDGWQVIFETPKGNIGVWSSWLQNKFTLESSEKITKTITDDLIINILGVQKAQPVPYSNDYSPQTERLWAKFYGPIEPTGGRVWIDFDEIDRGNPPFPLIKEQGGIDLQHFGRKEISTFPYSFFTDDSPESPTTNPQAIQKYKNRFILLASELALRAGGPTHLTINYGFAMVPENLQAEGYDVTWQKGQPGVREGGEEVTGKKGNESVVLRSHDLIPWSTVRRFPLPQKLKSPDTLGKFILEEGLTF